MKRFMESYSFAIILLAVSLIFVLVFAVQADSKECYVTVTVEEGETLWNIAQQYSEGHNLTTGDFVKLIETENGIAGGIIRAGDKLVVPVQLEETEGQMAGSDSK
ncbi:cell division suppressor protein YneA [Bacillus massilinigeriensis]|uniref:cell division suppressor protein YneA n=1 Tax=Bacillus mediterraneensis TaxID=1805474 RepID=UPI0008F90DB2|nr:LysM peptidoglycan-binding domain-containing protein [Bacillus mediterraneensis]